MGKQRAKRRIEAIMAASVPALHRGRRIVVLCYHSVHPSKGFASATPQLFEQQIEWLQEHCEIVPYSSIPTLAASPTDGRPLVAITFDDGYEDNHRYAFPILLTRGVLATVFVTTGLVDGDHWVINRFASLWAAPEDEVKGLSWSQVSEMRAAGIEIGAHTHSHPILADMGESDIREEIERSRAAIEDHLGEPVRHFAYPFGKPRQHVSPTAIEVVAQLGCESAATIMYRGVRATESPLTIPRFPITRDSMQVFSGKIHGRLDAIGLWQAHAPLWLSRLSFPNPSHPRTIPIDPHD